MQIFEPKLTLTREADGQITAEADVLVPNQCYSPGGIKLGAPPGHATIPEALAIQVVLLRAHSICTQRLDIVRMARTDINITAAQTAVAAFCVVVDSATGNQEVVGTATAPIPGLVFARASTAAANGHAWKAVANLMPPKPDTLTVCGSVTVGHPGHRGFLVPADPPGINPKILILDVVVVPLPGYWPQVVTDIPVSYADLDYQNQYDQVTIRRGASDLATIKIQRLQ